MTDLATAPREASKSASAPAEAVRHPWPVRTARWILERHGLGVLPPALVLYALGLGSGAAATGTRLAAVGGPSIGLGFLAFWSWYLMLRALDDIGDREEDRSAHPGRLLSRGVVRAADLRWLAFVALLLQAGALLLVDAGTATWTATLTWAASLGFLGLVAIDFGARARLTRRPTLRRALRMPASVLPLLPAYVVGGAAAGAHVAAPFTFSALALLLAGLGSLALYDVTRKFAPGGPGEASWSGRLGEARARVVVVLLLAGAGAACAVLLLAAGGRWSWLVMPAVGTQVVLGAALVVRGRDTAVALPMALGACLLTALSLLGASA